MTARGSVALRRKGGGCGAGPVVVVRGGLANLLAVPGVPDDAGAPPGSHQEGNRLPESHDHRGANLRFHGNLFEDFRVGPVPEDGDTIADLAGKQEALFLLGFLLFGDDTRVVPFRVLITRNSPSGSRKRPPFRSFRTGLTSFKGRNPRTKSTRTRPRTRRARGTVILIRNAGNGDLRKCPHPGKIEEFHVVVLLMLRPWGHPPAARG